MSLESPEGEFKFGIKGPIGGLCRSKVEGMLGLGGGVGLGMFSRGGCIKCGFRLVLLPLGLAALGGQMIGSLGHNIGGCIIDPHWEHGSSFQSYWTRRVRVLSSKK